MQQSSLTNTFLIRSKLFLSSGRSNIFSLYFNTILDSSSSNILMFYCVICSPYLFGSRYFYKLSLSGPSSLKTYILLQHVYYAISQSMSPRTSSSITTLPLGYDSMYTIRSGLKSLTMGQTTCLINYNISNLNGETVTPFDIFSKSMQWMY